MQNLQFDIFMRSFENFQSYFFSFTKSWKFTFQQLILTSFLLFEIYKLHFCVIFYKFSKLRNLVLYRKIDK